MSNRVDMNVRLIARQEEEQRVNNNNAADDQYGVAVLAW